MEDEMGGTWSSYGGREVRRIFCLQNLKQGTAGKT